MADDKVRFEVVTPARVQLAEDADLVVVPGGDGDFGILPGHAPLLSTIRPGVLDVYEGDKISRSLFVAGGFAEASAEGCTVLVEEAVPVEDIDASRASERVDKAQQAVTDASEDTKAAMEAKLAVAVAYLTAATGGSGRH